MGGGAINDDLGEGNPVGGDEPAGGGVRREGSTRDAGASDAGADPSPGSPAAGPSELPDFELLAEIGRGGFGSVWIAKHRHTGDAVAIKFIPPRSRETELKGLQMLRQRVREGQDHLVWSEYIGEAGDFIYCVMDLADNVVEGPLFPDRYEALTLLKYLKQRGRLDVADAQVVVLSMARGLAFLQAAGLRHGDVKPANVLRVRGRWKLADYGMMGALDVKARGGTRSYVPPEGPHGERADQYALGIVLHELVFGRKPSKESSSWPSSRLGTGLRRVCDRMLEPEPSRRFASMSEVVEALEALEARGKGTRGGAACPHCGEGVDDEQEVCGGCGGDLWQTCPACQHRGSVLQRFCTKCRAPVHAIAALEQELTEAATLLSDGRHREVTSRAEGPLADLCHEVAHQLGRMQSGDMARVRRAADLRERLDGRRRRLIEQAEQLRGLDERIASAHAAGQVTELRAAVETALHLLPENPNYRRLRAELPRLEAQASWNALLAELGNPDRTPKQLGDRDIRRAIRAIRLRVPDDPEVRRDADRLVKSLVAEQARRVRNAWRRSSARHREAGRTVEALEALRRAESAGVADDGLNDEIAELVVELEGSHLEGLVEMLESDRGGVGAHRRRRRAIREIEAIRPSEPRLADWKLEWSRQRRAGLLGRIKERCLAAIGREDVPEWQRGLALAYRVAGRDAVLASRVLELDNALQARWNLLQTSIRDAAAAEAAGDVVLAFEKWREASAIACESPAVSERLENARAAAEAYPRKRRRRLIAASLVSVCLLAAIGAVSWQAWNWWRIHQWLERSGSTVEAVTDDYGSRLRELNDRTRFPLGPWGLDVRVQDAWREAVETRITAAATDRQDDGGSIGPMASAYASLGASQREWLGDLLLELVGQLPADRPDPAALLRLDRILETAGVSGLPRERLVAKTQRVLSRIAGGEEMAGLDSWWLIARGAGQASDVGAEFQRRIMEAFDTRRAREVSSLDAIGRELATAVADGARRGRVETAPVLQSATERLALIPEAWWGPGVEAAREDLTVKLRQFEDLARGFIEIDVSGLGRIGWRVLAIDGQGVLIADRQVDEATWSRWQDGRGPSEHAGKPARSLSVEDVQASLGRLGVIELLGTRWRPFLPDPSLWDRCDRILRARDGSGIRDEDQLEDLAVTEVTGETRAYAMPEGFPSMPSGSMEVGLRLFLRAD